PAVSGQGGHDQTFAAARAVVWGFNLGAEVGHQLLREHYNPRCLPPWSEQELRHKCTEADAKPFDKPRGYLLNLAGAAWPADPEPPPPPPPPGAVPPPPPPPPPRPPL